MKRQTYIKSKNHNNAELHSQHWNELSEHDRYLAFLYWQKNYSHTNADKRIEPFINLNISEQPTNWLKTVREALQISAQTVADKMNLTRSGYSYLEKNEEAGSISLQNLKKAAEAMDCELIYAIRPKNRKLFSLQIWQRILPSVFRHPYFKTTRKHKPFMYGEVATKQFLDTDFRRSQGWTIK